MKTKQKNISIIKSITNEQKIGNFKKKSPIFKNRFWLISLYFIKLQIIECYQKWEKMKIFGTKFSRNEKIFPKKTYIWEKMTKPSHKLLNKLIDFNLKFD